MMQRIAENIIIEIKLITLTTIINTISRSIDKYLSLPFCSWLILQLINEIDL